MTFYDPCRPNAASVEQLFAPGLSPSCRVLESQTLAALSWCGLAVLVLCVILAALPPKWDPAIRLKKWNERIRAKRERGE